MSIVRALIIAVTQLVWLTACAGRALAVDLPGPESASERQGAIQWPSDNLPSAQLAALVEDQNASRLQAGVEKPSENAVPKPIPATELAETDTRPRLNAYWDYGVVLESSDKAFRFHIGGLLEFDNTWYRQTGTLPFLLQDGSDMRRARLRADGSMVESRGGAAG